MRTVYGPIFTLRPFERGIQETLGKYNRFVTPGLGFQIPIIHLVRIRDVREHTMEIHPQAVITKCRPSEHRRKTEYLNNRVNLQNIVEIH